MPSVSHARASISTRGTPSQTTFDIKTCCLFCAERVCEADHDVHEVLTLMFQETIRAGCVNRNDPWAIDVLSRIEHIIDLPAADSIYHQQCSVNFRNGKNIPGKYSSGPLPKRRSVGRPVDQERLDAFTRVLDWFENNCEETITLSMLVDLMKSLLQNSDPYTHKYMRQMLIKHYAEENVHFVEKAIGHKTIVYLSRSTASIVREFYRNKQKDTSLEDEETRIISAAADIICSKIKLLKDNQVGSNYPSTDLLNEDNVLDCLPKAVVTFFSRIIRSKSSKKKIASIAQSLVQAARPNTLMMPLQVHLAVSMHSQLASRYLIDLLHAFGFCMSYNEVRIFLRNAAVESNTLNSIVSSSNHIQYVADNVDDITCNLDAPFITWE